MCTRVASDTYGPDHPMVLEQGERHFPRFARLLNHGVSIAARAGQFPQITVPVELEK